MSDGVVIALITAGGSIVVTAITLIAHWIVERTPSPQPKPAPPSAKKPSPRTAPVIEMSGRWQGEQEGAGWVYDFTAHLQVDQSPVKGHINWTLIQCPSGSGLTKQIGTAGVEYVSGSLEGNQLTLSGYQTDNPKILTLADYYITLGNDLKSLRGTTIDKKDKTPGTMHGQTI